MACLLLIAFFLFDLATKTATRRDESLRYLLFSTFSVHFQILKKKEAGRDAKHKVFLLGIRLEICRKN